MSADLNEKRGRRRRQNDEASAAAPATDENELMEDEGEDEEDAVLEPGQRGYTAPKGKPTAGRRNKQQTQEEEGGLVSRSVGGIRGYIQETREELEKVTWPTRLEVIRLFRIVLGVMIVASIILGLISLFFTVLFRAGILNPILFVVFFAVVGAVGVFIYRRFQRMDADAGNPRLGR